MERRTALRHLVTGVAGVGAGYSLLNRSTDNASAAVSLGTLDVAGDDVTTDDGTISALMADVSGQWDYDLPAGKSPARWEVSVLVGNGDTETVVGTDSGEAKYLQNSGSYSVSGDVLTTDAFSAADFAPPDAGMYREVSLGIGVVLLVLDGSDTRVAKAALQDTATVKVTHEGYQATDYGQVSGNGGLDAKK